MNIATTRRTLLAGATVLMAALSLPTLNIAPALADKVQCPYCDMPAGGATASILRAGTKRVAYKCVYCALAEAKTEYKGDLTVSSPSEKKTLIILKRTGGKWTASPATAHFVSPDHLKHKICQAQARAFSSKAAAQAFAKKSGGTVMTLAQINAIAE